MPRREIPQLLTVESAKHAEIFDVQRFGDRLDIIVPDPASGRKLVEDTLPKINDSNVHQYLETLHDIARRHESHVPDLLRMIGREPSTVRKVAGTALAKTRELWAGVIGFSGGAVSGWTDLELGHDGPTARLGSVA